MSNDEAPGKEFTAFAVYPTGKREATEESDFKLLQDQFNPCPEFQKVQITAECL
jgi:hypothetical protein